MSHSSEAALAPDRRESPSLAPVRREVERLAGSDEAKVLGPFTDVLLAKAPADLPQERGPEALARTVLDVFRFLERASPDRVNVEVVATNTATAVHALVSDRPFVIDTVRECVAARDLAIEYIIYPVPHVRRDEQGRVVEVRSAASPATASCTARSRASPTRARSRRCGRISSAACTTWCGPRTTSGPYRRPSTV